MSTRDNLDLATTAHEMADRAPAGSFEKAVAGSVAITCATTRTFEEARHALGGIVPAEVRRPAIDLLERLAVGSTGRAGGADRVGGAGHRRSPA